MYHISPFLFVILIAIHACPGPASRVAAQEKAEPPDTAAAENSVPARVEKAKLGNTRNVHQCANCFLAGQFTTDDIDELQAAGIQRVISLRTEGEIPWDEEALVKQSGMEFVVVPFREPDSLTDEVFDRVRELLQDKTTATICHCGSANRVGAVWLPWRVLDDGVPLLTAIEEAKQIGLRNEDYLDKARRYIRRKQTARDLQPAPPQDATDGSDGSPPGEQTTPAPGINDSFLDPDLQVDKFIERFELESREVYAAREAVLRACKIESGQRVADIGAGTGLYTQLFAEAVGESGWVYAIDIAPRFVEHINRTAEQFELRNISGILGSQSSVHLPASAVDLAFVCDTYHHFESPAEMVNSIFRAIKPGGQLVVIDFERIPGVSREWIVSHVRAGKPVFRHEIESGGFRFEEQVDIPGFAENYFLRFRKPRG